jgi:tetratricopeptide (TPR) repeat protein
MRYATIILFAFLISGCDLFSYKNRPADISEARTNKWLESYHPNLAPMYGNRVKSVEGKAADEDYVDFMMELYDGDTIKAAKAAARDGWHFFYRQVIDTAMFRFNQSWLLDSTYAESYFGFAAIREYQRTTDEAETFYALAYAFDPTDTLTKKCLHRIATIKERQKDTIGLINAHHRVLNRFPDDDASAGKLGFFYSLLHQPDSAFIYYNLAVKNAPEYDQTYINRGWQFYVTGKFEKAIDDFSTAISKNEKSTSAYANRSNVLMTIGRYQEAIPDIKKCIELDPSHHNFNFALAECYFQLGQRDKVCNELDVAIKKGSKTAIQLKKERC